MSAAARMEAYPGPDDRDGFLVRTPFDDAFVEELKAMVPSADRRWWADSRAWWVAAEQEDLLVHLLLRRFGGYEVYDEDAGEVVIVGRDGRRAVQGGFL